MIYLNEFYEILEYIPYEIFFITASNIIVDIFVEVN